MTTVRWGIVRRSAQRLSPPLRACRAPVAMCAAAMVICAAPARAAVSPADRAATHAYLQAEYDLVSSEVGSASSATAAAEAVAARIGGECPGVLHGSPQAGEFITSDGPPGPRERGEAARRREQRATIDYEVDDALLGSLASADAAAQTAFANAVAPLRWSDPRVAALVAERITELSETAVTPSVVCSDMRAWAASGYRTLAADSKERRTERQQRREQAVASPSLSDLLERYEGPAERALSSRTEALDGKLLGAYLAITHVITHLHAVLGVPDEFAEAAEHAVVVGHGRTLAGSRYTIKIERPPPKQHTGCRFEASITLGSSDSPPDGGILSFGSGRSFCVSPAERRRVQVECDEGVLEIAVRLPAKVRAVRLQLSNGRTVTSPTIRIPPNLGGPAAIYVQRVRGGSPAPVSITELDRRGNVVRIERLRAPHRCRREAVAEPVIVPVVRGTTPTGVPFTITAARFGPPGTHPEVTLTASGGQRAEFEEGSELLLPRPAFHWQTRQECPPQPFTLIYGLLKPPAANVSVREPTGLVALQKVAIPAALHAHASLVYGVFSTPPSELVVTRANGSTLLRQSLASSNRAESEFCAGYAEG